MQVNKRSGVFFLQKTFLKKFDFPIDKSIFLCYNKRVVGRVSSAGRATALQAVGHRFEPYTLHHEKGTFVYQKFLFLFIQAAGNKPSAWHIIRRKSVYHQGRVAPLYLITRQRASSLRLDEIQCFALMICNSLRN